MTAGTSPPGARRHRSLYGKLVLLLLAVGLAPVLAVGAINYWRATGTLNQQIQARLGELAVSSSDKLDRTLAERYNDVQAFSNLDAADALDSIRITDHMNQAIVTYAPFYRLMLVANRDGEIIAANTLDPNNTYLDTRSLLGQNVLNERWFDSWRSRSYQEGFTFVEDVHTDQRVAALYGDQGYVIGFSHGIFNQSGNLVGVWLDLFDWNAAQRSLAAFVAEPRSSGESSLNLIVVNRAGLILAGTRPEDILNTPYQNLVQGNVLTQEAFSQGAQRFSGLNWRIIATQERSEALRLVTQLTTQSLLVVVLSVLLVLAVGVVVARSLVRPIQQLQTAANAVAAGDLQVQVPVGDDELGQLGQSFNSMTAQLQGLYSGLEDKVAQRTTEVQRALDDLQHSAAEQQRLAQAVDSLSIPIIPLTDKVFTIPLVGNFDTTRITLLLTRMLEAVEQMRVSHVLLDITGMETVDTQVAGALIQAARAAQLLGCQTVLVGIRPEVAQTLVGLGVELDEIQSFASMQAGFAAVQHGRSLSLV